MELGNVQFGLRSDRSTIDPVYKKSIKKAKRFAHGFRTPGKAYDRVPRDLIWCAMRKGSIPEGYVKVIQVMYRGTKTKLKNRCGRTGYFEVKVGLHQGSALSLHKYH